jgi:diguanylate cyclase (GGDEF)-like protein
MAQTGPFFRRQVLAYATAGFILYVSGVVIYSTLAYRRALTAEIQKLDHRLAVGAQATYNILGEDFFERAKAADSITAQEDWDNILRLNAFNAEADLAFVYSVALVGDDIYLTSSSASAEELANNVEVRYFDHYDSASPAVYEVFRTQVPQYVNYTDDWGDFRTLLVPRQLADGRTIVLGAEVELGTLAALRWQLARQHAFEASLFLLLAAPLFIAVVQTLQKTNTELRLRNRTDTLTGLSNRSGFSEDLTQAIKVATQDQQSLGLLFLDLDGFKEVNDGFGHHVGDLLLVEVASILKEVIAPPAQLFRVGGDEFCIIVKGAPDACEHVAQQAITAFNRSLCVANYEFFITCSIGGSLFPQDGTSYHELLKHADAAMYGAKGCGANQYKFYDEGMSLKAKQHIILRQQLHEGIANQEFFFVYQPQVHVVTGEIVGLEALLRWRHGDMGLVSPGTFIPFAESTGLIDEIFGRVLGGVLTNAVLWNQASSHSIRVSINYSAQQLFQADFYDVLLERLAEAECDPHWIEIEITERSIMQRSHDLIRVLERLQSIGITVSVDDFGTGYSSLSYLKDLPIDKIKVDRCFVKDLPNDQGSCALTRAIVELGLGLSMSIIAEGVEEEAQVRFLDQIGCSHIQGYFFYRPMPEVEILPLIRSNQRISAMGGKLKA